MSEDAERKIGGPAEAVERKVGVTEASLLTGFSKDFIREAAAAKKLPHFKNGLHGQFFFTERELTAWVASMRVEAES